MTHGNLKHQAAAERTSERVAELRYDIRRQLLVLVDLDHTLEDLAGTRQSVGLGFMTPEARAAADKQAAIDRGIARGAARISTPGLAWLGSSHIASPAGAAAAPVTMAAVSVSAEILFTLQQHVRRLAKPARELAVRHEAEQLAAPPEITDDGTVTFRVMLHPLSVEPPTSDGDVVELARHLGRLVEYYASRPGLEAILRELDHLEQKARDVVDGPSKSNHPEPCPWCGQHSLVIHHRAPGRAEMFVRCEGRHRCVCDDEWCACHRNGRHRHEWVNAGRAKNPVGGRDRYSLASLITYRKEQAVLETKALDTLERIKALHQPIWTDADDNVHTQYVQVAAEDLAQHAPDHVCVETGLDACEAPDHEHPGAALHSVPACVECQTTTEDGDPARYVWPCRTYQLAAELDQPDSPNNQE